MFGLENPPLCLSEPCNEGYYQPQCESKEKYEHMDNLDLECPQGCKNCDSAIFCTECIAGFILANDLCEPCPDGKYWSAPQTCLGNFLK